MQGESEQRPHKLSYHLSAKGEDAQKIISQLQEALKAAGVRAKTIYSGGMDVDILPEGASKGEGLKFLLRQARSIHVEAPKCAVSRVWHSPCHGGALWQRETAEPVPGGPCLPHGAEHTNPLHSECRQISTRWFYGPLDSV